MPSSSGERPGVSKSAGSFCFEEGAGGSTLALSGSRGREFSLIADLRRFDHLPAIMTLPGAKTRS